MTGRRLDMRMTRPLPGDAERLHRLRQAVVDAQEAHEVTDAAVDAAIKANGEAYDRYLDAVRALKVFLGMERP